MLAYASKISEALVNKGRHIHDNSIYYDASVVKMFVGIETVMQHECKLLAELAPRRDMGLAYHGVPVI